MILITRTTHGGDMDVQEIPLDIKHEELDVMSDNTSINSSSSSSSISGSPIITGVEKAPDVIFSPLSNINRLNAAKKFHIKLRPSGHIVSHRGIGFVFKHKPVVTVSAKPDGACLFNSISLLLSGSDVYSHVIQHVICNYICAKENQNKLAQHIPRLYTSGKEYVEKERMQNCFTWGTDLEIVVLSQISGHDVFAYTQHKNWVLYSANMKHDDPRTPTAFYLNNSSGNHFDPVLTSMKW